VHQVPTFLVLQLYTLRAVFLPIIRISSRTSALVQFMQFCWLSATRGGMKHQFYGKYAVLVAFSHQNFINCTNADVRLEILMMGRKTAKNM
jgi:hypothetical protein